MQREHSMDTDRFVGFVSGLLSGSIVGAAVVILSAPRSGSQTRQLVVDTANEILEAGRHAIADKRQDLRAEYQAAIQIPLPPVDQE
jgi:gas vesicle protein